MVSPPKIFLEILLLVTVFIATKYVIVNQHKKFIRIFTGCTILASIFFYYYAALPLYQGYAQSIQLSMDQMHSLIWFDIFKWGLLTYFIVRFAIALQLSDQVFSFQLLAPGHISIAKILIWGISGGILGIGLSYVVSFIEYKFGILDGLPWPYFAQEADLYRPLGIIGGIRNLFGEEILCRLGVQALVLFIFRKYSYRSIIAIILSALFFEFWHNGFKELYFMNFSSSMVFGIVYHYKGYEAAAISHCVADWLGIVILPLIFF